MISNRVYSDSDTAVCALNLRIKLRLYTYHIHRRAV